MPGSAGMSGAGGAKGSDGASDGPGAPMSPTGGEGSAGGGIAGATSTSFTVPARNVEGPSAAGGSTTLSGPPEAGPRPDGGGVGGPRVNSDVAGEASPGGSDVPRRSQSGSFHPPDLSAAGDPAGTDESWSGD